EKRLEDLDPRVLHDVFAVNAFGPIAVVQAVLPLLRHTDPAVVVNLSARVGSIGDNGFRSTFNTSWPANDGESSSLRARA
ncbi:MAG: hypothetical protein KC656_18890, partial [Myxococcales bacterium]|nr:hypothetical protein [Myxococcales bacterium]